jgi:hypothetical protein
LTTINLFLCNRVTSVGVSAIAAGCPRLQSLNIGSEADTVGCDALVSLARSCPALHTLNVAGRVHRRCLITDDVVEALCKCSFSLRTLDLSYCAVTQRSVVALAAARFAQRLQSVDFTCTDVESTALLEHLCPRAKVAGGAPPPPPPSASRGGGGQRRRPNKCAIL